jgi:hypothetical protein
VLVVDDRRGDRVVLAFAALGDSIPIADGAPLCTLITGISSAVTPISGGTVQQALIAVEVQVEPVLAEPAGGAVGGSAKTGLARATTEETLMTG